MTQNLFITFSEHHQKICTQKDCFTQHQTPHMQKSRFKCVTLQFLNIIAQQKTKFISSAHKEEYFCLHRTFMIQQTFLSKMKQIRQGFLFTISSFNLKFTKESHSTSKLSKLLLSLTTFSDSSSKSKQGWKLGHIFNRVLMLF